MFYNLKEGKIDLGYTKFDYIAFGNGTKPLIMIQGLNTRGIKGAGASLALMYRIFAKDFRVYLFDRRENLDNGITVRDFALDIAAAMEKLGVGCADVLGVSEGGMIAEYLALERPELVNKLVLAVTLSRNNDTVVSVINRWVEFTENDNYRALIRDMAEKMYSEKYMKRYKPFLPFLTLLQKPKNAERFISLAKSCLTCSCYGELSKIKCPTLIIGGGRDLIVTREASEEIAEALGCELHIYEELGHAAYEEAPDFNRRVYGFLISES